ncbi:MAG: hypothetical protein K6G80_10215 [Treponema sp.]|nr:hypothetical protein [Treponema sp.]
MKAFFYRALKTASFIRDDGAAFYQVVPVRFKNEYLSQDMHFENGSWREGVPEKKADSLVCEYVEILGSLKAYDYTLDQIADFDAAEFPLKKSCEIEEMGAAQLSDYLAYKKACERAEKNQAYSKDANGIHKDLFAVSVTTDEKALTLTLTLHRLYESGESGEDIFASKPAVQTSTFTYDMKAGRFFIQGYGHTDEHVNSVEENSAQKQREDFSYPIASFLDDQNIPAEALSCAFGELVRLASLYTGVPLLCASPQGSGAVLKKMYALCKMPFESCLYPVLCSSELEKKRFVFERNDSLVFKKFCREFRIPDCATVRKAYAARPASLLTVLHIKQAGFSDINLYRCVLENRRRCYLFDEADKKALSFFVRWSRSLRGESATLRTLLKSSRDVVMTRATAWKCSASILAGCRMN